MKNKHFVQLHVHSEYSQLDGLIKFTPYVRMAKEKGFKYAAITDHGDISGAIKFQQAFEVEGIIPIIGCELYIIPNVHTPDKDKIKSKHIVVFVKNQEGWENLLQLLSYANLEGFYRKPRIDFLSLSKHHKGLIISTACVNSFLLFPEGQESLIGLWKAKRKQDVYLEIMPHNTEEQKSINKICTDLHETYDIPLVASNDCHYLRKGDAKAHEVLLAIQRQAKWDDPKRWKFDPAYEIWLKDADEMVQAFEDQACVPEPLYTAAMRNTVKIAEACSNFRIEKKPVSLPFTGTSTTIDEEEDKLFDLVFDEFPKRFNISIEDAKSKKEWNEYRERLNHEFQTICSKGFVRYFLIVYDLVQFCKKNDIMVGPGRGSAGASLILYTLGITNLDPIKFDLPFSRFINEERISEPDIDLDFEDIKREQVRKYLSDKYGKYNVAAISTFLTMKSRGVVRDVSRVFNIPLKDINTFAKSIDINIEEALKGLIGKTFQNNYPEIIELALELENTIRGGGVHAAGLVISSEDLRNGTRCNLVSKNKTLAVNWGMEECEHQGLMKLDVLGLNALTILNGARKLIAEHHGVNIDFEALPLDDKKVFDDLSAGHTAGIFQFTTHPMTKLTMEMGIESFQNMSDAVALVRPGPQQSGMTAEFIKRKHGAKWKKKHKIYEEVTKNTYGLICIHEDTIILKSNGDDKPIKEINVGDELLSVNINNRKIEYGICKKVGPTRFIDGYKVTISNGESIVLTSDHKILTQNGMKSVNNLDMSKDIIAIASETKHKADKSSELCSWLSDNDNDVAYLLGYLTGNGRICNVGITLCCGEEYKANILSEWIKTTFPLEITKYFSTRCWYIRLFSDELVRNKGRGNRKTKWYKYIEEFGLNKKSILKDIPVEIKRGNSAIQAAYLSGLMDSDGHIGKVSGRETTICNYSTSSEKLKRSACRILMNFGISYNVYSNHIFIWNTSKLKDVIEPFLKIRKFDYPTSNSDRFGYIDKKWIEEQWQLSKMTQRDFAEDKGIARAVLNSNNNFAGGIVARKLGFNFGDLNFMKIKKIEHVPECQFYGIEVPEHHNLIGNGIVISNCYQEDVMNVVHKVAGLPYSTADKIRKIIGKKGTAEDFKQFEKAFLDGCAEQKTLSPTEAKEFWEGMQSHASYSFVKAHATGYAMIGYWMAWLKCHYSQEFLCSSLTYGSESNKNDLAKEARRLGWQVVTPKAGISKALEWTVFEGKLYAPFIEIKGLGESGANEAVGYKSTKFQKKGFFSTKNVELGKVKKKIEFILDDIHAYEPDVHLTSEIQHYFDFDVTGDPATSYPKLYRLLEDNRKAGQIEQALVGDIELQLHKEQRPFRLNRKLSSCHDCKLRDECKAPVHPSPSRNNMMLCGEAPGESEDNLGEGFVGKVAVDMLWPTMAKFKLTRDMFHVTNIVKCFPSITKTPTTEHIQACEKWLDEEIEWVKPFIILAFGNTCVYKFKRQESGITKLSGTIEWNERYGCWIFWSIHPSYALRRPQAKGEFEDAIRLFSEKLESIGGI